MSVSRRGACRLTDVGHVDFEVLSQKNVKGQKEAPALPTWAPNFGINLRCAWGRLGLCFFV